MTTKDLCALLEQLHYPEACPSPASLSWAFEQEGARQVFRWLCLNLSQRNVLTAEELREYKLLVEDGKVLQGSALEEALKVVQEGRGEDPWEDEETAQDIQEDIELLEEEASMLANRLEECGRHEAALLEEHRSATDLDTQQKLVVSHFEKQIHQQEVASAQTGQRMADIIEEVDRSAKLLERDYSGQGLEEGGRDLLSLANFKEFIHCDRECTRMLEKWHCKQFEMGAALQVAQEAASPLPGSPLYDVTQPCKPVGVSEEKHQKRLKELDRLARIFGTGESQRLLSYAVVAREEAALGVARRQQQGVAPQLEELPLRFKQEDLKKKIRELEKATVRIRREIATQCATLAGLSKTYVFEGDYELKLRRQRYFLEKYNKFIHYLTEQVACHVILREACQLDADLVQQAQVVIAAAKEEVNKWTASAHIRMEMCNSRLSEGERSKAEVEEEALRKMEALFATQGDSFSSTDVEDPEERVKKKMEILEAETRQLRKHVEERIPADREAVLSDLAGYISKLKGLLDITPLTPMPSLVSYKIKSLLNDLNEATGTLTKSIGTLKNRKALMDKRTESEAEKIERQVFVDFFCDPDNLKVIVEQLREWEAGLDWSNTGQLSESEFEFRTP